MLRRPRGPETRPVAVSCGSFASWNCGIASSAARSSLATSVASSGWVPGPGCTASTLIFSGVEVSVSPSSMLPPASRLMRPLQPLRDQLLSRNQPLRASCSVTSSRPEISKNSPLNGSPESNEQEAVPFGSAFRIRPVSFGNRSVLHLRGVEIAQHVGRRGRLQRACGRGPEELVSEAPRQLLGARFDLLVGSDLQRLRERHLRAGRVERPQRDHVAASLGSDRPEHDPARADELGDLDLDLVAHHAGLRQHLLLHHLGDLLALHHAEAAVADELVGEGVVHLRRHVRIRVSTRGHFGDGDGCRSTLRLRKGCRGQ
jgi:hypothetical protein